MKSFDVDTQQAKASQACLRMKGGLYRHYKGDLYMVVTVAVDEATGAILVVYESMEKGFVWSRRLDVFEELLADGAARFTRVPAMKWESGK